MGKRKTKFNLGDRVRFTDTVDKVQSDGRTTYKSNGLPGFLKWGGGESDRSKIDEGVVVRIRVLHDYDTYKEPADYDGGYGFSEPSYFQMVETVKNTSRVAYEVAYHINRKPALVLAENMEKIDNA